MLTGVASAQSPAPPIAPLVLRPDDAAKRSSGRLTPGSHIKVSIPSLPHIYVSHSINGALIRPSDNERGWEYDVAVDHRQIDDVTYEFQLRRGVRFQDGTPFNADAVVLNMEYFKKAPYRWSGIDKAFDKAEKVDDHTVRFKLTKKYGSLLNDLIWLQFYTEKYLTTNPGGWNGRWVCPSLSMPGPYGLGPYILTEGYVEGDRQTPKAVLKANPYYWDQNFPKVETVTIYTELNSLEAKERTLYEEGELDITVIPPEDKVETILAPYSKLVISSSNDNIAVHINMINGNPRLRDPVVRRSLNAALNRDNLLYFVYEDEGNASPISQHLAGVKEVYSKLDVENFDYDPLNDDSDAQLRRILNGLSLRVLTQDRYLPLWRGIETHWGRFGVKLEVEVTSSEKDVFAQLFTTGAGKNDKKWDFLVWGNDDWYYNHPFTVFFMFRSNTAWCTLPPDPVMDGYIDDMFGVPVDDQTFPEICERVMRRAYGESYALYVPTPNKVFAVNKEVVFRPFRMACMPIWKVEIADQHWSVRRRQSPYPDALRRPVEIIRYGFQ